MVDDNREKIVFGEDTGPIISEILQKYNLEETNDEVLEKLEKEEPLRPAIVLNLVEDVAARRQSEKTIISLLQEKLTIPQKTAENLAEDIKNKLLPIARKATPEEIAEIKKEEEIAAAEEIPFEPFPLREEPTPKNPPFIEKPLTPADFDRKNMENEKPYLETPEALPQKELPSKEVSPQTPDKKSQDVYREPIE